MKKKRYGTVLIELIPIGVGIILSYLFWRNNLLLTGMYLILITLLLKLRYQLVDGTALIIGFFVGCIVEIIGTSVAGYQVFVNQSFLGIPLWLPLAWAYGFMAMKRIGRILA